MKSVQLPKSVGELLLEYLSMRQTEGVNGEKMPSIIVEGIMELMCSSKEANLLVDISFFAGWWAHEKYGKEPPP